MKTWSVGRKALSALVGAVCIAFASLAVVLLVRQWTLVQEPTAKTLLGVIIVAIAAAIVGCAWLLHHLYLDIKANHGAQQRLQDANRLLESLLDNIPAMIFAKDPHLLTFVHFNREGERVMGYTRESLLGKSDRDFFSPEQVEFFLQKDREALAKGDVVDVPEEEIDTLHGRRVLHTRKVPVRDQQGQPLMLLGISMDITQQKENERRILALNTELQRHAALLENSNQELESFCYTVSHDLRSPLRAINGYAQMLQHEYGATLDEQARRYVHTICSASERMARLIDDLLEFSRLGRQVLNMAEIDMAALVSKVVEEVLDQRPPPQPTIELGTLLPAHGDRRMLQQVWLNLLDNAVKYTSTTPAAHIRIESRREDHQLLYSIADNGVGFDMRYADNLFGVFQRLHGVDEFPGTGVGLAIVQRILSRHGGRAWAHSAPGQGATFYFSLPISDKQATSTGRPAAPAAAAAQASEAAISAPQPTSTARSRGS